MIRTNLIYINNLVTEGERKKAVHTTHKAVRCILTKNLWNYYKISKNMMMIMNITG